MLGIFLAEKVAINPTFLKLLLLTTFLSIFYFTQGLKEYAQRWTAGLPIYLFLGLLGYQLSYHQNELRQPKHFQKAIQAENYVIGTITNIPILKNNKIKVELATQTIGVDKHALTDCEGKLLLYLNQYEGAPIVHYGDQILLKSKIQPILKPKNPKAFDYNRYLYFQNIHFQSFVYKTNWKVLATNKGHPFWQTVNRVRSHYLQILKKNIQSDKEVAIASALVLGYKANLTPELKRAYSETGAIHVLAVSGLHVGIISTILLFLFNCLPFKGTTWNWLKFAGLCIGIWGFTLLTGLPPSVKRAAIMFTFLNIGLIIQRGVNKYNVLAIAAFIILLLNPYALFEVGFQFSFLAVIGIIFFAKRILRFWSPKSRWLYEIWNLIVVGVSAQLTVFPLILYYFHQVPTYFWLSGLFVVPLAGLLMKLSLLLLLVNSIHGWLASTLGWLIAWFIYVQNCLIEAMQNLPIHILNGFWISEVEVMLFYGFIFGLAMLLLTYRVRWVIIAISCLLVVSCVQLGTKYSQVKQQQITVYSINKKSAIDFIDGAMIYELADSTLTEDDYIYNIQNNRWAKGTVEIVPINEADVQMANLFKKGNVLQFHQVKMVIVEEALPINRLIRNRLVTDYLVIQKNPSIDIHQLLNCYDFKTIIFDSSNTNWSIKKWVKSCERLGISYHDGNQDGAFTIDLNGN